MEHMNEEPDNIESPLALLQRCPKWIHIMPSRDADGQISIPQRYDLQAKAIIDPLLRVCSFSTEIVRQAAFEIVDQESDRIHNLLILNRLMFNVPEVYIRQAEEIRVPPWMRPIDDPLWPVKIVPNRGYTLDLFRGYFGADWQYLSEFDYFNSLFGRRDLIKSED